MNIRPGVHWQLVAFSGFSLWHGFGFGVRRTWQEADALPEGIEELPDAVLILDIVGWTLAGLLGLVAAVVIRRWYLAARCLIGVMCGAWSGAFAYGWIAQDHAIEWFPAGMYALVAAAVLAPPLWQVTIPASKRR